MKSNIYLVRDLVSQSNSDLTISVSDAAATRSFGIQLEKTGVDRRIAADLMLVRVGQVDYYDGASYPSISGHFTPVPVCSGLEALDSVKEVSSSCEA